MSYGRNKSGIPLSSTAWLRAHHRAKLPERRNFAQLISSYKPRKIVDLGCGPGFWLEILNEVAPADCEFIGIDTDVSSINEAQNRAKNWTRSVSFEVFDLTKPISLPSSDMFLAFNIFSYLSSTDLLMPEIKKSLATGGRLIVRQYDGANIRFGPMPSRLRLMLENSLYASVSESCEFQHYDIDRVCKILEKSDFENLNISFELFQRCSPFDEYFSDYFCNTIKWTLNQVSDEIYEWLNDWAEHHVFNNENKFTYFSESDLVAVLS